jgi:hypothetical protein
MSGPDYSCKPERVLTKDEVRAELARIRPGAADALNDAVAGHAARCRQDPRELLNEAVHRALTTRAILADIPFDAVLAEIARSIASSINISRHRARQHVVALPIDEIVDLLPAGGYAVMAPDEIIEQERIRDLCIDALAPFDLARSHHRQVIDRLPQAAVAPGTEIALNRRERREIPGQHPPLATTGRRIEDGVHYLAQVGAARPAAGLRASRLDNVAPSGYAAVGRYRSTSVIPWSFLAKLEEAELCAAQSAMCRRVKRNRLISPKYF